MRATSEAVSGQPLRVAWWGRVSTDDQQDPTLSLPRQLHSSRAALPSHAVIVAHFYDVESGRKDLDLRGHGRAHERFQIPIPRDGGIQDLLAEAARPERRFDAVICESIERIARRTYFGTKIEHDLERVGVVLFAADEPIALNGKRATTILTRRVKQSVAEWYVLEILEKSWDGTCEHTRQGWNVGRPPYGYLAEKVPHPVPSKRAAGGTKTRLVPDPVRAPVIHQIFTWRAVERVGYTAIAGRLNADLERYPPPVSTDPARSKEFWSGSSVREVIINPKYTGYMVYNRRSRARGGTVNPKSAWIWSETPTHEPIVTTTIFEAANEVAADRERSRSGSGPNRKHPDTVRTYALRSFVQCRLWGSRMQGKYCRQHVYCVCEPTKRLGGPKAKRAFPDHPTSVWVREDALMEAILEFFATRVFGGDRHEFLKAQLRAVRQDSEQSAKARVESLRQAVAQIEERQARQVRVLEAEADPGGALLREVRRRIEELELERLGTLAALRDMESTAAADEPQTPELIDQLPILQRGLEDLPESLLRRLFDVFRLVASYDKTANRLSCEVTIRENGLDSLQSFFTHLDCAPDGFRTRDLRLERAVS